MQIILSNRSGVPIYEQIASQITEMILTDELKEGDALPSVRQLARDLHISVITTTRAYSDLERGGFVTAMQGKGYYVLSRNSEMVKEQYLRRVERYLSDAITAARLAGIGARELTGMLAVLLRESEGEDNG